ncbi:hypothetical protein LX36DRAFT_462837 [Colletotrichum falcatum]|nr:hypothetical protein LX36DRAFT_462837 [Colletotrichum falcatum]
MTWPIDNLIRHLIFYTASLKDSSTPSFAHLFIHKSNLVDSDQFARSKMDIQFKPSNVYGDEPETRSGYKALVRQWAEKNNFDTFCILAVIVNGPHTSRSDRRVHLTVDFSPQVKRRVLTESMGENMYP